MQVVQTPMSRNRRSTGDRRKEASLDYNYVCRRKIRDRRKRQYGACRYQWWPPIEQMRDGSE